MKKTFLFSTLFAFFAFLFGSMYSANAQNQVFFEDFEGDIFPPTGWTAIDDAQPLSYYHWQSISTSPLEGQKSAYIDTKVYNTGEDHQEPAKHEWLITPEINLPSDKSCQFSFIWQAHKIQALDNKTYNTWVLVSPNNGVSWDTIWSLTDEAKMINSGVPFPWANFGKYKSELDLTKYKGKKVKIAFYYHNFEFAKGDMFKLDNVGVNKYDPILAPVAVMDPTSYTFSNAYIGVTISSGLAFSLINRGVDTLRITGIEGLEGTDFKCMISDYSKIELKKNDALRFSIQYTPSLEGAKNASLTIKTNGGDVTLALTGNKLALPADYTLESFEGETFPPLGWESQNWRKLAAGSSGYYSASSSFNNKCILKTPRIDLSQGSSHYISIDFINYADDEEYGSEVDNVDNIEFSSNGGSTWVKLYTIPVSRAEDWTRHRISLPASTSNDCYIRFISSIEGDLSYDNLISQLMIDNIVLPPIYGKDLAPQVSKNPIPKDAALNQYINRLRLSWAEVLHASSYKVKVSTTADNTGDVLNINATENYVYLESLKYATTYYWSVTPTNSNGDASDVILWSFTTISDQTVSTFPLSSGFEEADFPALGWRAETLNEGGPRWARSNTTPYEGKYSAYCSAHEGGSFLAMPPLALPTDMEMQIAFIWGNSSPAGLKKQLAPSPDTKVTGADTIYFEGSTDETNWKIFAFASDVRRDTQYWQRQKVVLSEYAGKTLYLRWRYSSVDYARSSGAAIDNVIVEEYMKNGKAVFNMTEWNAGVVNDKKTTHSKNLLNILNDGDEALTIESVSFTNPNFSCDLQIGASIQKSAKKNFTITFSSIPAGEYKDSMKIVFANGLIAHFPVRGVGLPVNKRCYTFDDEAAFTTDLSHFTMLDADGKATCEPVLIYFPKRGTPLPYIVMNVIEADWRNIYPISGEQCLAAFSASDNNSAVEDWLISEKITATQTSKVRFFAKSYGSPEDFSLSKMTVLVSETDNNKSSFKAIAGATNMDVPYNKSGDWTEFEVDLSDYDGKAVHIALRQTMDKNGFVMFMDDVWFENFQFSATDNQAPRFTTTPPTGATIGQAFSYTFKAVDPDGDPITFSEKGLPSWLTITYNGTDGGILNGTPITAGNVFFNIMASDGQLETVQEVLFAVHGSNNQAPSFTTTAPTTANVGTEFVYEFKATDPQGDAINFSIEDKPSWMDITYNRLDGGTLRGTPVAAATHAFKLKVSDGQLDATQAISLEVKGVSIEGEKEISFLCYPNPVNSILYIETSERDYEIQIMNLTGSVLYKGKNVTAVSTEELPKGLYILRLNSQNKVKVLRIVKQ